MAPTWLQVAAGSSPQMGASFLQRTVLGINRRAFCWMNRSWKWRRTSLARATGLWPQTRNVHISHVRFLWWMQGWDRRPATPPVPAASTPATSDDFSFRFSKFSLTKIHKFPRHKSNPHIRTSDLVHHSELRVLLRCLTTIRHHDAATVLPSTVQYTTLMVIGQYPPNRSTFHKHEMGVRRGPRPFLIVGSGTTFPANPYHYFAQFIVFWHGISMGNDVARAGVVKACS